MWWQVVRSWCLFAGKTRSWRRWKRSKWALVLWNTVKHVQTCLLPVYSFKLFQLWDDKLDVWLELVCLTWVNQQPASASSISIRCLGTLQIPCSRPWTRKAPKSTAWAEQSRRQSEGTEKRLACIHAKACNRWWNRRWTLEVLTWCWYFGFLRRMYLVIRILARCTGKIHDGAKKNSCQLASSNGFVSSSFKASLWPSCFSCDWPVSGRGQLRSDIAGVERRFRDCFSYK